MRDRRNTNLSISSTDSSTSSSPRSKQGSFNEKRYASPPPSDGLPVPVTTSKERRPVPRRIMLARVFTVLCGLVLLWQYGWKCWGVESSATQIAIGRKGNDIVASHDLPDEPTALIVADPMGTSKWTISIPHNYTFPLASRHYSEICSHGAMLRDGLSPDTRRSRAKHFLRRTGFFAKDQTFLDIEEAEDAGALPSARGSISNVCQSSMTFVLESEEASFGQTLLLLWLSYGLAMKEGRSFFIDDTRFTWGRYESYFKPAPRPTCNRPPPQHIVPCPQSARHLVVSSATAAYQFGADFQAELQGIHKHGLASQRNLFALLRRGYEDLFHLAGDDATYVSDRVAKLKEEASRQDTSVIGMHIRRGDKHPFEYQYSRDYLPLERFTDGARSLSQPGSRKIVREHPTGQATLLLASDDPDIINSQDLQLAAVPMVMQKAQERIQLATKAALDKASPVQSLRSPGSAYVLHKDENVGWEGGFYSALFYSLGGAKTDSHGAIPEQALRMRELVGRAYLLDLAVLGQSDGIICGISSATCRVLAVMQGWDAVKAGRWVNVDDGRAWSFDGHR